MAGLNPNDPTGEMALTNVLAVNRMVWRQRQEKWELSRADAIGRGKAIGGAPFGYAFTDPTPRPDGKGVVNSRLVVIEELRPIVVGMFERRAAGASWLEVARWLDQVAPKADGAYWARNTVKGLMGRRTYLGEVRHGQHVKAGAHEAIVSPALWRRAQSAPGQRTPRGTYLLSGRVRCSGCGRRMRASSGGRKKSAVFVCVTAGCSQRYLTITVKGLDEEVVAQVFARLDAYHLVAAEDADMAAAQAEVDRLTGTVERLAAVVPEHPRAIEAHGQALRDAEQELSAAEDRLYELTSSETDSGPDVRELRSDWPTMTLAERRTVVQDALDTVLVRRAASRSAPPPVSERIRILFRGEAPDGLLDNGRSGPITSWSWAGDDDPVAAGAAA